MLAPQGAGADFPAAPVPCPAGQHRRGKKIDGQPDYYRCSRCQHAVHWRSPRTPDALAGSHPCPGCGAPAAAGNVACPSCWRQVPAEARRPLTAAFRARLSNPAGFMRACAMARELVVTYAKERAS